MKKVITILSIITAAAFLAPVSASAETKKKPAAAEPEKKPEAKKKDTYPLYGEVVAITDTLLTIKGGKDKEDRKYDINKDTRIHNGDKPATVKDVKVGAWVGGLLKKASGKGNDEVESLNIGVKQKEAKPEAKTEAPTKKKKSA
jgi:hypothetical protein